MMTIDKLYSLFLKHPYISIDSRTITPGSIFFALKGTNFNGNEYVQTALEQGAAYAITDEPDKCNDPRCIATVDVLATLQKLAQYHRQQLKIPVIGITGSNGKTTTKELIFAVLKEKFNTMATTGNLNNHIGVPLTLLKLTKETEIAIIEMGANHLGEIEELCNIALPDFGIITNIGRAHLEGFGSVEGIIETKSALYRHIASKGGYCFINSDNSLLIKLANSQRVISYGSKNLANCLCAITGSSPFLSLKWLNYDCEIRTQLSGTYNFENVMAAICIGDYFSVTPLQIKKAIESYIPINNRSQHLETKYNHLILDCYNANPSSMEASIISFKSMYPENGSLILGDMFELGNSAEHEHEHIISLLKPMNFKHVILAGEVFSKVTREKAFIALPDTDSVIKYLETHPMRNANIMIKGSRGMKLERLIDYL